MRSPSWDIKTMILAGLLWPLCGGLAAQSIWRDQNPYKKNAKVGQIVRVRVHEKMIARIDSDRKLDGKTKIVLMPDTANLDFLKDSTQSKTRAVNNRSRQRIRRVLDFSLAAQISRIDPQTGTYTITASKRILTNGIPATVTLTGMIDDDLLKLNSIPSGAIANLTLSIVTEAPPPRDTRARLNPDNSGTLSEADRNRVLLNYIREILGGLNQ